MFKSKWIFLFIFSTLSLSQFASSYEASQVGISKERLDKISPVLEENIKQGDFLDLSLLLLEKEKSYILKLKDIPIVEKQIPLQKDSYLESIL